MKAVFPAKVFGRGLSRRALLQAGLLGTGLGVFSCQSPRSTERPASGRVAVAGGALAEIATALGAGVRLVGTDTSSTYPDAVAALPKFGYQRQLSGEGILSLAPDLLLASDEAGPPAVLDQLRSASVRVVIIPNPKTTADIAQRVRTVGEALDTQVPATALAAELERSLASLEAAAAQRSTRPRVLFLYARGPGNLLVGGRNTPADLILGLAGCLNAASALDGFSALTPESVISAAPEYVLVPEKGLASLGGPEGLFATPGLAETPAARAKKAVAIDDLLLLGLGPRVGTAIAQLVAQVFV